MSDEVAPPEPEIEEPEVNAPTIFLSYSHDTKEHKQWVASLAQQFVKSGVQVLFDQWDLNPGDDVPKFMERAVTEADRVLMVCTEEYVRKADDGKGGVGYEAMIVTGELVKDLGTKKFIPIVRQDGDEKVVPKCVGTRLYINLCEGEQYEEEFERLIRELHEVPSVVKPALGKNPFAGESFTGPAAIENRVTLEVKFGEILSDPVDTYNTAVEIIRGNDALAWRRFLRAAEAHSVAAFKSWKANSQIPRFDKNAAENNFEHVENGVAAYSSFLACLLAAAESGEPGYADQTGWIDVILNPDGWELSGSTYYVDFPETVLFVAQALTGGLLMDVRQGKAAYSIGSAKIGSKYRSKQKKPIYSNTSINGWPESLGHNCSVAWAFLNQLIDSWTWLHDIFGSSDKCRAAVTGYYLLLNFLNFVKLSKDGGIEKNELNWAVTAPLMFSGWGSEICNDGYRLLLEQGEQLQELLIANGLEDEDRFKEHWAIWIKENGRWLGDLFRGHYYHDLGFPNKNLPDDLRQREDTLEL